MNHYSIYKVTNKINQKVYIGFSKDWKVRKRRHKSIYTTHQSKFYTALKTHGWENFIWEEIYCSLDKDHCFKTMEQFFIEQFDSIKNGYNIIEGGSGTLGSTKDKVWINNGSITKRCHKDQIPEGWLEGRIKITRKVKMSQESKDLISMKNKQHGTTSTLNKTILTCPHCGKSTNVGLAKRWHFDNCKVKTSYS